MSDKREENIRRLRAVDEDTWRTIKGAHVLIGGDGTIKGGAGGKLNGRKIGMKAISSGSKGITTGTAKKQALQNFTNKANGAASRIENERQRAYSQGKSIFGNENVAQEERGMGQAGLRLAERMNKLNAMEKAGNSPEQKLKGAAYLASAAKSGAPANPATNPMGALAQAGKSAAPQKLDYNSLTSYRESNATKGTPDWNALGHLRESFTVPGMTPEKAFRGAKLGIKSASTGEKRQAELAALDKYAKKFGITPAPDYKIPTISAEQGRREDLAEARGEMGGAAPGSAVTKPATPKPPHQIPGLTIGGHNAAQERSAIEKAYKDAPFGAQRMVLGQLQDYLKGKPNATVQEAIKNAIQAHNTESGMADEPFNPQGINGSDEFSKQLKTLAKQYGVVGNNGTKKPAAPSVNPQSNPLGALAQAGSNSSPRESAIQSLKGLKRPKVGEVASIKMGDYTVNVHRAPTSQLQYRYSVSKNGKQVYRGAKWFKEEEGNSPWKDLKADLKRYIPE